MKNTNKYLNKIIFAIIIFTFFPCFTIVAEECRVNPYLNPAMLAVIERFIEEGEKILQQIIEQGHGESSTAKRLRTHLAFLKSAYYGDKDYTLEELIKGQ
jgi:hypothetical protein